MTDWNEVCPAAWQARVVRTAVVVLPGTPGVVAAWLGGSLATGYADIHSDVDLNVAVADDRLATWRDAWPTVVERCAGPLVLSQPIGGEVVGGFSLTRSWEHVDLVVHALSGLGRPAPCRILHDPGGLLEDRRDVVPAGKPWYPAGDVTLFLYFLGNLVVTLGRDELVLAHGGVGALRDLLVRLMLAENGVHKTDGQKRLNPYLTDDQRSELASLPTAALRADDVILACQAIRDAFVARARRLAEAVGEDFPEGLFVATDEHLRRELGEVRTSVGRG